MHYGTIKDLTEIWYVLDMKKNIISLVLVGNGLQISLINLSLKATKCFTSDEGYPKEELVLSVE